MSDLDELMALRPRVSELIHALEWERRDHAKTKQALDAANAMNTQLRASLVAVREAHRNDTSTPPMGVSSPETSAITRTHREHA